MTTMLERAARAVGDVVIFTSRDGSVATLGGGLSKEALQEIARAVLMAVREPDEVMQIAGGRSIFDRPHLFNPVGRENWPKWEDQTLLNRELSALSCHAHRAIIDAILSEEE